MRESMEEYKQNTNSKVGLLQALTIAFIGIVAAEGFAAFFRKS